MQQQIKIQRQDKNADFAQKLLNIDILLWITNMCVTAYKWLHIKQGEIIIFTSHLPTGNLMVLNDPGLKTVAVSSQEEPSSSERGGLLFKATS